MKSTVSNCMVALTIVVALGIPLHLRAQDKQASGAKHHHYKLIDLGTLGGAQSFGDHGHGAGNINSVGFAAGVADTALPNLFYPNFNPLMVVQPDGPDPYVFHAFISNGEKIFDLGALPGANSSAVSVITNNGRSEE